MQTIKLNDLSEEAFNSVNYIANNDWNTTECRGLKVGNFVQFNNPKKVSNGTIYTIVAFYVDEKSGKLMVLYRNASSIWGRCIEEFMDGRFLLVDMEDKDE